MNQIEIENYYTKFIIFHLQPRGQRFIETAATTERSETGCKAVPAPYSAD